MIHLILKNKEIGMLKFNRRNKRLVIPVGINPSYNINVAELYNVSDADVEANDVLEGKIAYGKDGKIVGTLDVQSRIEESYQEGYEFGYNEGNNAGYLLGYDEGNEAGIVEQKAKLESITITENGSYNREDGWNSVVVDVPDLNGDYNEGVEDGIEIGKAEVIEGMNDATITAGTVFKGEIGYGKDGERIVGDFEYVEGFNFGKIGYSQELSNELNSDTAEKLAYSKQLYDAWNPNRTSAQGYFQNNTSLVYAPNVNCSNIVNGCQSMFYNCSNLITVPDLNTSNCQYFDYMLGLCKLLQTVGLIDTSSAKSLEDMFYQCSNLTSVPLFNTSNVTNMQEMFSYCSNLTSVPLFNTSNVTNMASMFRECTSLTSVPEFNTNNVTNVSDMFYTIFSSIPITYLGGFINLGKGFSNSNANNNHLNLQRLDRLTYQSCMNVINKVYDMNLTDVTNAKITFNSTAKALLSDEDIAIATSKGWTIA